MSVFYTVVAGVGVFVVGQIVVKFVVEPWHDYRMLIGRIAHALVVYGYAHNDPRFVTTASVEDAKRELMNLSGELWQRSHAIPIYGVFARILPTVPSWEEIVLASGHLGGLAQNQNEVGGTRREHIAAVRKALRLHDPTVAQPERRPLRDRLRRRTP